MGLVTLAWGGRLEGPGEAGQGGRSVGGRVKARELGACARSWLEARSPNFSIHAEPTYRPKPSTASAPTPMRLALLEAA